MGCWNDVCMASGFPIGQGDEAMAFVLARPEDYRTRRPAEYRSTPWFLWAPVGFPLRGAYDGHGRLEGVREEALARHTLGVLRRRLTDPSAMCVREFNGTLSPGQGLDGLWEMLRDGRGALAKGDLDDDADRPVTYALARADVFEAMVAGYGEPGRPVPGGDAGPYAGVAAIERNLRRSPIASPDPWQSVALGSAIAPHGDLLEALPDVGIDAFCVEVARLVAFAGAMRLAGIAYGPRQGGGQDDRWAAVARHHEAMAGVLARRGG